MALVGKKLESNEERARAWFAAMSAADPSSLRRLMAEDIELFTAPSVRVGGVSGRDEALRRLEQVLSSGSHFAPGSLRCRVVDIVTEGDQTAAHVVMTAQFSDGKPYESVYLIWQRWRDGELTYQLELFDAAHKNHQREA
jgi:ketosteroid isomerase-like protein